MEFHWNFQGLEKGVLKRRYKRFLADVVLPTGETVVAHCPNTGAMTGCQEPGSSVWLSASNNPKRKLAWTLELVETQRGMVCVHSSLANRVVQAALEDRILAPLADFKTLRTEVQAGSNTRLDLRLEGGERPIWVEIKAVSWCLDGGRGLFPDAVSLRARRHIQELAGLRSPECRSALVFCVFHSGIKQVAPAVDVDPEYAAVLWDASRSGLEVYGLGVDVSVRGLRATHQLPVEGVARVG